jgi:hypothetical protein
LSKLEDRFEALGRTMAPDLWTDIGTRETRELPPSMPSTARRVLIIATAFVLAGATFALMVSVFTPPAAEQGPRSPGPEPLPNHAEVTQTIDVGQPYPSAVVVGEGGVWVAAREDGPGGDVVRLHPQSGEIVARIPVDSLPGWEFGGGGMATGLGSIWVVGARSNGPGEGCCTVVLTRIDPVTNQVADTTEVGPGGDADVWVEENGIWVLAFAEGRPQEMWLYRLDSSSLRVVTRIDIPSFWSQSVFGAGSWIWVHGGTPDAPPEEAPADTLFRIDPATNEIVDLIRTGWLAKVSGDVILVGLESQGAGSLEGRLLDTKSGAELAEVASIPAWDTFAADGQGGFWLVSARAPKGVGPPDARGLWHLNAGGVIDSEGELEGSAEDAAGITEAFDPATNSIWVVHYKRTVSRIQLTTIG